jgi:dolichol-phosphate mannosyltransferase
LLTVKFVTSYGYRPQHLLGPLGLISLLLGAIGLVISALGWFSRAEVSAAVLSGVLVLLGPLLIGLGLLAELVVAASPRPKPYSIAARISETTTESS